MKALGKLSVPGHRTNLDNSRAKFRLSDGNNLYMLAKVAVKFDFGKNNSRITSELRVLEIHSVLILSFSDRDNLVLI